MDKKNVVKHLNQAIEKQIPDDSWDRLNHRLHKMDENEPLVLFPPQPAKKNHYKKIGFAAAACLIAALTISFTPALAAIQGLYDKIFDSEHIDDSGMKAALSQGLDQNLNQTYYDQEHDITVHFEGILMDDKETKLLVTYQSKKTDLKDYYLDIFEGKTSINLVSASGSKKLKCVGWGSRYYNKQENKVVEALSFESLKDMAGQTVKLEVTNLTRYEEVKKKQFKTRTVEAVWPLSFTLDQSVISERKIVAVNKSFDFEGQSYTIKQVEFSGLETRVVVTGSDTKLKTDEITGEKYKEMSKLENQFLHARTFADGKGYFVAEGKSGVFLKSEGKRVDPIFNKGEVEGADDEFIMFFAPVKNQTNFSLEVGDELTIPLQ